MSKSEENKVQIFHRVNRLKVKAGVPLDKSKHGYIDPMSVVSSQIKIDLKEEQIHDYMEELLENINLYWKKLQDEDDNRTENLERLHNFANNIKDLSDTFDYTLMNSFGLSLRNFCEFLNVDKEPHRVIVKAHLDVMGIAFHERLKGDETKQAEELKNVLSQAIKKYS